MRRLAAAAAAAVVAAATPMVVTTLFAPAISSACLPGETASANTCAPFCLPDKALDVSTGLCVPVSNPSPNGVNPPMYKYSTR